MFGVLRRPSSALVRRVVPAMAGLAIASGAIVLAGSAASAEGPSCRYDGQRNTCLWITETWPGSDVYEVHIGIDVYMNPAQAQDIFDRGGWFTSRVMGDDPSNDALLFHLDVQSQGVAPFGLSAEFHTQVPGSWLDEDWGWDEVYATVVLTDPGRSSRSFNTGVITGDF